MTSFGTLAWTIWQRNNRGLLFIAVYFAFYSAAIAPFCREDRPQVIFAIGSLILVFCYLALTGIFMYQDSDVGVRGSAYPVHMLTLPVRTYKLVLMPMVLGSVAFLGSGLIVSRAIHAAYEKFPFFWPAMMITAILAMLQALFWYPLGVPYSKLVLTLAGIPGMIWLVSWSLESKVSETFVCQALGVFTLICYAIAYNGVVRARRGELQMFTLSTPIVTSQPKKDFKWLSFKDKFDAQRWYEWRQQGLILPCLVLFVCILFYIPSYWNSTDSIVYSLGDKGKGTLPMVSTFVYTYFPLICAMVPIIALIVGCGAKRTDIKHADRTFHLFFGTRPMVDGALVTQKIWTALKSSLVAWCIVLVLFVILLPMKGTNYTVQTGIISTDKVSILELIRSYLSWDQVVWLICALTLLIATTWRNFAIGFWTELSGKTWLRYGYPIMTLTLIFGVPMSLGNVRGQENIERIYDCMFGLVWLLVLVRLFLMANIVRKQLRSGVLSRETLKRGILAYLVGGPVLLIMGFVCTFGFRENLVNAFLFSPAAADWFIVGLTLLWIPVVRVLLATEMLHHNRHRSV